MSEDNKKLLELTDRVNILSQKLVHNKTKVQSEVIETLRKVNLAFEYAKVLENKINEAKVLGNKINETKEN